MDLKLAGWKAYNLSLAGKLIRAFDGLFGGLPQMRDGSISCPEIQFVCPSQQAVWSPES
ncbi:hypothetical protein LINPERHAP1_LOCUS40969 [Linum perenne]